MFYADDGVKFMLTKVVRKGELCAFQAKSKHLIVILLQNQAFCDHFPHFWAFLSGFKAFFGHFWVNSTYFRCILLKNDVFSTNFRCFWPKCGKNLSNRTHIGVFPMRAQIRGGVRNIINTVLYCLSARGRDWGGSRRKATKSEFTRI